MSESINRFNRLTAAQRALVSSRLQERAARAGSTRREADRISTVERTGELPLSFGEERLWLLHQLQAGFSAYNMCTAFRMHGQLNVCALIADIDEVVRRHEILRTSFPWSSNGVRREIMDHGRHEHVLVDLSSIPADRHHALIQRLHVHDVQKPFDLLKGPLLRVATIKLSDASYVLQLATNHIISDATSNEIFYTEVSRLFGAFIHGEPSPLPELDLQYADYAAWQRRHMDSATTNRLLDYWRKQLGAFVPQERPTGDHRDQQQQFRGGGHSFDVDVDLTSAIQRVSQRLGTTTSTLVLAVFAMALGRLQKREDVIIGLSSSARNAKELNALIGFFVNILPIRIDLSGNIRFSELVARTRTAVAGAVQHQELPLEVLLRDLAIDHTFHNPLFDSVFVFLEDRRAQPQFDGLTVCPMEFDEVNAVFDLTFNVNKTDSGLSGKLQYALSAHDGKTMDSLIRWFRYLLRSISRDPDRSLQELWADSCLCLPPLVSEGETQHHDLSFHQERIWFIDEFETQQVYSASPVYHNLPLILELKGLVQPELLENALNEIIRRHSVLRTRIAVHGSTPNAVISPTSTLSLERVTLAASNEFTLLDDAVQRAMDEARQPFDLKSSPLIRALLIQLTEQHFLLVITVHHLVADRQSLRLLMRELATLYAAGKAMSQPTLPSVLCQYPDYAKWQRSFPDEATDYLLSYWRGILQNQWIPLDLPYDQPRMPIHRFSGAYLVFYILGRQQDFARINDREHSDTLCVLLTALCVLLATYDGHAEVTVGTSLPCRDRIPIEHTIGPIANLIPIRVCLPRTISCREALRRVTRTVRETRQHQDMPFDRLVQAMTLAIDMSRTAMFDVVMEYDPQPLEELDCAGLTMRVIETNQGYGKHDLHLYARPSQDGLAITVTYNTLLFQGKTIERFMGQYTAIVKAMITNTDRELGDVVPADPPPIPHEGSEPGCPAFRTLPAWFEAQARMRPDKIAVVCDSHHLSYHHLDMRAELVANRLRRQGVHEETLTAICLPRSLGQIVSILAVLKAGGAYLPIDSAWPAVRVAAILGDAKVVGIITNQTLAAEKFRDCRFPLFFEDDLLQDTDPADTPPPGAHNASLAYCIYTSGSSGSPKGTLVEHRNVIELMCNPGPPFVFGADDVWTMFHSCSFDLSVWEMWGALLHGGMLVIVPWEVALDGNAFAELVLREGVTVLTQTPGAFSNVSASLLRSHPAVLPLRCIVFAGEALYPAQLAAWREAYPDCLLVNMYGITETTVHVTSKTLTPEDFQSSDSNIGRPIPPYVCYIMDDQMRPLPQGGRGEIVVGGAGVSRGYLNQMAMTAERFVPDPYRHGKRVYRSGDLARHVGNGDLVYLGRGDNQVQVRGYRVELAEIEAVLQTHPRLRKSAVVATQDCVGQVKLVAFCEPEETAIPSAVELREYVLQRLPEYMAPAAFHVLAKMPLTPNGKIDRKALLGSSAVQLPSEQRRVPPRSPREELLALIWAEVLGLDEISIHDHFFELGGHSLLATKVISRVREVFRVELPLRLLFEHPTVAAFATCLQPHTDQIVSQNPAIAAIRPRPEVLPLSFGQQQMWFIEQLQSGISHYNMPAAIRISGRFNFASLLASVNEVVRRHEILRTSFPVQAAQPIQKISPCTAVLGTVIDLQHLPACGRQDVMRKLINTEGCLPFDLTRSPLLRIKLLRLAAEEHVLLLTLHHIVCDGWSLGILIREVLTLYRAFSAGTPSQLCELAVQYADFALWQRRSEPNWQTELAYWKHRLAGLRPSLPLPSDRPRPATPSFAGAIAQCKISPELTADLRRLSRQENCTLFMTLLSGLFVLLQRYTSQEDLVVGTAIAGRNRREVEDSIGLFLNSLALRADLSGNPTFRNLLGQVRHITLDAYDHQDFPFEKLVEAMNPARDVTRTPIFQVLFLVQNTPVYELQLPGAQCTSLDIDTATSKLDLTFSVREVEDGLLIMLEYNSDLFETTTVERMLAHYCRLLQSGVNKPDLGISDLPLLTDNERRSILTEWDRSSVDSNTCMHTQFEHWAEETPDSTAITGEGITLTYGELNRRSNEVAALLLEEGLRSPTPVAILLKSIVSSIIAALGVLKAGAPYVFLDPSHPPLRIRQLLEGIRPFALLTQDELSDRIEPCSEQEPQPSKFKMLNIIRAVGHSHKEKPLGQLGLNTAKPSDPAYLVYTSGSTGKPKGILQSHRSFCQFIEWQSKAFEIEPGARVANWATLTYDASYSEIFGALCHGATVVVTSADVRHDPPLLVKWLCDEQVTLLQCVPSFLQQILAAMENDPTAGHNKLAALKHVQSAGEVLPPSLVEAWQTRFADQTILHNLYGPSECVLATWTPVTGPGKTAGPVSIGKAFAGRQILILDSSGQLSPIGIRGEIYIRSRYLSMGYYRDKTETDRVFIQNPLHNDYPDPVYRTGDYGRWRSDGNIEFMGRIDSQMKFKGVRIEPTEIECSIAAHPAVKDCAVSFQTDGQNQQMVAYLVTHSPVSGHELRAFLRKSLPEQLLPSRLVSVPTLPRLFNGKLDRLALPQLKGSVLDGNDCPAPPRTDLEAQLVAIWCELLRRDAVGVNDDFFDLGGHSLLAVQVINRIRAVYCVELSLLAFLQSPRIASVAAFIEQARTAPVSEHDVSNIVAGLQHFTDLEIQQLLATVSPPSGVKPPGRIEGDSDLRNPN